MLARFCCWFAVDDGLWFILAVIHKSTVTGLATILSASFCLVRKAYDDDDVDFQLKY